MTAVALPRTRSADLVLRTVGEEVVVYDTAADTAHALSPLAARLWPQLDGRTTTSAAAAELSVPEADVAAVVVALDDAGLLAAGHDRRAFLTRAAVVAGGVAAFPIVTSLAAPLAAAAASNVGGGGPRSVYVGNALTDGGRLDGATSITTYDTTNPLPAGSITDFRGFAGAAGTVAFVVLRGTTFTYVGPDTAVPTGVFTVTPTIPVPVLAGDLVGFYQSGTGVIAFAELDPSGDSNGANRGGPANQTLQGSARPTEGGTFALEYPGLSREYSYGATVAT